MMKHVEVSLIRHVPDSRESDQRDKKLKKACQEFEAIFTYELLKSMRRTVDKCGLFNGGQAEQIYESLLDQELSKRTTGYGSNSVANLLYQQFKRRHSSDVGGAEHIQGADVFVNSAPRWPIQARVSSAFGLRKDPVDGQTRFHRGIDLAGREGALVRASLPGRVSISEYQKGYGNLVMLDHGHGVSTLYAHNKSNLVKRGDWVGGGTPIARLGSTGRSTGSHLHFEVRKYGRQTDPLDFLRSDPHLP